MSAKRTITVTQKFEWAGPASYDGLSRASDATSLTLSSIKPEVSLRIGTGRGKGHVTLDELRELHGVIGEMVALVAAEEAKQS